MKAKATWEEFIIGYAPTKIKIRSDWIVLDVGSGHNPFIRADVLLEKHLGDSTERSGVNVKKTRQKLVVGDVQLMPFPDKSFDYIIASHIAEHVEDPEVFCKELMRVGKAGYIETPGKIGEKILTETFHRWYVYKKRDKLIFEKKKGEHKHNLVTGFIYALLYYGRDRVDHKTFKSNNKLLNKLFIKSSFLLGKIWKSRFLKKHNYTTFEWKQKIGFRIIS